ncbi:MAG: site-specific DNA-methyltransferase [Slackia sp.]|nr:site-specific DNA-methyltransferase [Slackia sp.]
MEKVNLATADIAAENAAKIAELFPDIVTEVLDEDGNVRHSIDVEALKAHVGDVAEDKRERYQFTWPGKQKARAEAIRQIDKTMRPCPDESVNWDTTENLYIEGDNLDALKILRETYAGKIKMIYIDPPYNTGHDFVYNDIFARTAEEERAESGAFDEEGNVLDAAYRVNNESNGKFHSDWCSMMYPRLVLARDLLSEDGVIFISIDDSEHINLVKLMDGIFGPSNYLTSIIWKSKSGGANDSGNVAVDHEYVVAYSKERESNCLQNDLYAVAATRYNLEDDKGRYALRRLDQQNLSYSKALDYDLIGPDGSVYRLEHKDPNNPNAIWRWSKARVMEHMDDLVFKDGHVYTKFYEQKGSKPRSLFIDDRFGRSRSGSTELRALLEGDYFSNPKPVSLIKTLLAMGSNDDSVVLDFFSGSATMAEAAMRLNLEDDRKIATVLVQLPEATGADSKAAKAGYKNICEIGKERIRRAGKKIVDELEPGQKVPDVGFRVLKIDSSNFEDVKRTPDTIQQSQLFGLADNLKSDRTPEDLLFQLLPKFEIPFTARIEKLNICGKTAFSVDDDMLLACFDREVSEDVIRAMADRHPLRAVLRDVSFIGDDALANFKEIFKTLSPATETKVV